MKKLPSRPAMPLQLLRQSRVCWLPGLAAPTKTTLTYAFTLQPTSLPNNTSGIDAVTLKTGIHLLICNPIEKGRNKLAVLASLDGKKWNDLIVLEDQPQGEFSYPAIIQGNNGTIHITYTYNREKIKYVHLKIVK